LYLNSIKKKSVLNYLSLSYRCKSCIL